MSLPVSYWLQNQQKDGQRAGKAFKDLVTEAPNMVTHDSHILVKGKNLMQGTLDVQIRQVVNMTKLARVQLSTQKAVLLDRSILLAFFLAIFHQGHQGCYTGSTWAHECDSSDTHKMTNNPNLLISLSAEMHPEHISARDQSASGH